MEELNNPQKRTNPIKLIIYAILAVIIISAILNWKDIKDGFMDGLNGTQVSTEKK